MQSCHCSTASLVAFTFLQISKEYTTGARHLDITKSIAEHVIHTSCDKVGCLVGRYASCQRSTDTSRVKFNDRCELHFPLAVDVMAAVWPAEGQLKTLQPFGMSGEAMEGGANWSSQLLFSCTPGEAMHIGTPYTMLTVQQSKKATVVSGKSSPPSIARSQVWPLPI